MASVTPPTNELQAKGIKEQEEGQVKRERGERERERVVTRGDRKGQRKTCTCSNTHVHGVSINFMHI